ncbi:NAD(P)-binding protein [Meredithblackwellia eburnea MCA 4105]
MSASEKVSICIVGAPGLIGVRHTEHCLAEPLVDLSCIVDPTPVGPEFAKKNNLVLYTSVDEMLQARKDGKVKVDGVILATPNATHVPLGIQVAQAGVHVLVEKPMSTDIPSGRELVKKASEAGSKILVGQHRRFHPTIINAKKLLNSGALGRVLGVSGLWTALKPLPYFEAPTAWRKEGKTGGVILINLVHDIDLLRHLFGDIVRVYCEEGPSTRGHDVEETGACTLKFASGAVGTFIFSDAAASPYNFEAATGENPLFPKTSQNVYHILGTKGSSAFPELKPWAYAKEDGCWTDNLSQGAAEPVDPTPPFTSQLRNFVGVIQGTQEPNCSGLEALKTIITLEAIKESIQTGKPVDVAQQ